MFIKKGVSVSYSISWLSFKLIHVPVTISRVPNLFTLAFYKRSFSCRTRACFSVQFFYFHSVIILFLTESPIGCIARLFVEGFFITGSNGGLLRVDGAAVCPSTLGVANECLPVDYRFRCLATIANAPAGWAFSPRFYVSEVVLWIYC